MKKLKNNFLNGLIHCWKEISISDKALIIIMIFLLLQSIHNLFTPESTNPNSLSINLIVRTSIASIFGYFLSENFLKNKVVKSEDSDIIVPVNKSDIVSNKNSNVTSTNDCITSNSTLKDSNNNIKDYICNKTVQILIALIVCIIALFSLIIGSNLNLISSNTNPTVIHLRDLICNCIGFLLGHSNNSIKNSSPK